MIGVFELFPISSCSGNHSKNVVARRLVKEVGD